MRSNSTVGTLFGMLFFLLTVGGSAYGYIMNIVLLIQMDGFSGLLAARLLGIFMVIPGIILGYIPN